MLYINGITNSPSAGKLTSYVDDTIVLFALFADNAWEPVVNKTGLELDKVKKWMDSIWLQMNVEKLCFSFKFETCF